MGKPSLVRIPRTIVAQPPADASPSPAHARSDESAADAQRTHYDARIVELPLKALRRRLMRYSAAPRFRSAGRAPTQACSRVQL
jgi:hypothetical protein